MDELKKELVEEYILLIQRLTKLINSLDSEGFENKVGKKQYDLMMNQRLAMTNYSVILEHRLADLGIN